MPRLGGRWKPWRLMAVVAIAAMLCAAARSKGSPVVGGAIVGSCVVILAYERFFEALALGESQGSPTTRTERAKLFSASIAVATAIVGLSDLAFLAGFDACPRLPAIFASHAGGVRWIGPEDIVWSAIPGVVLALIVASALRHSVWPLGLVPSDRRRRFLELEAGRRRRLHHALDRPAHVMGVFADLLVLTRGRIPMQTTTIPKRARRRWLLPLLVGLFAIYFIAQVVAVSEVWTPTGPFDHFEGAQPHRVTTWVSVSAFGRSISLPIITRSGMKNTQFE